MATWLGPHIFYLVPKLSKSWDLALDDIRILLPDIDTRGSPKKKFLAKAKIHL